MSLISLVALSRRAGDWCASRLLQTFKAASDWSVSRPAGERPKQNAEPLIKQAGHLVIWMVVKIRVPFWVLFCTAPII